MPSAVAFIPFHLNLSNCQCCFRKENHESQFFPVELYSVKKDKVLRFLIFGELFPNSPYESDREWLKLLIEYEDAHKKFVTKDFEIQKRQLEQASLLYGNLRLYDERSHCLFDHDFGSQKISLELSNGGLEVRGDIGLQDKFTFQFLSNFSSIMNFLRSLSRACIKYPSQCQTSEDLDFAEAYRRLAKESGFRVGTKERWIKDILLGEIRFLEKPILRAIQRHAKKRKLPEFSYCRLLRILRQRTLIRYFKNDRETINHFNQEFK